MNTCNLAASISFFALLILSGRCHAQSEPQLTLKAPPAKIDIDGNIREWGDSLTYYSPEERINYMLANNKDTLYLAVKIYDRTEVTRVLKAGLTFSIDTRGKKKQTFSLTYPVNTGGDSGPSGFNYKDIDASDNITQADRDELMRETITTLRGIKLVGFKDIEDDIITTSNTYGIRSAINYDDDGNLIYEEAIPLKFFHADNAAKNDWAFNIKINGIARPAPGSEGEGGGMGGGGGRHGGGGGGMGGGGGHGGGRHSGGGNPANPAETSKTIDFWGKFHLAQ